MTDIAISVENVSKRYRIGLEEEIPETFVEAATNFITTPIHNFRQLRALSRFEDKGQRSNVQRSNDDVIWALKDVSFEVERGEVVGIIGRNGAGKSTLLKILSRITHPTSGRVELNGRVSSLLEVGTGFHPELTGRENIYLNGTVLGMTKAEVDRKFDEIVDFSGVEKFIDTPVKRYSSGMRVRLAFSVAAHLEPEILLIDEVLAVGDVAFQKKCLGKMEDIAYKGRTVLFISHNMGAVRSMCPRAIFLHKGTLISDGDVHQVVDKYLLRIGNKKVAQGEKIWTGEKRPGSKYVRCEALRLLDVKGEVRTVFLSNEEIIVEFEYVVQKPLRGFRFHLTFITEKGEVAFRTTDHNLRKDVLTPGKYLSRCAIPPNLFNKRHYRIMLGGGIPNVRSHIKPASVLSFDVQESSHGSYFTEDWPGVVAPNTRWEIDIPLSAKQ